MATASRIAYFYLFGHGRTALASALASGALTCPDDIFGKRTDSACRERRRLGWWLGGADSGDGHHG